MCKTKKQAFLTIRTTALYGWGKPEVSWGTGSTRWRWPMLYFMRVSSGVIIPLDSYMLQTNTREEVRGRVFSFHLATYGGFMQLSYLASGFAYDQWGIPLVGLGDRGGFINLRNWLADSVYARKAGTCRQGLFRRGLSPGCLQMRKTPCM
ncbi:hypothetical protein [Bacillus sp. HSf4]|uniref:hypothetical protein n=1 Tax=Bacillus sp. HSf4 TaxID=3035514 RepID=UPI002409EAD0|nr:hypothetical protein [Bacillus sp. HSf4]WFA04663.1 hypothetical protein P3X63_19035 [Bacillus sp. HSf4]